MLAGSEDVKNMLEDLGSLSGGRAGRPVLPDEQRSLPGGRAWAWLQPWAWISGLAWGAAESPKAAKLTLQVFGEGLHNARTIQVALSWSLLQLHSLRLLQAAWHIQPAACLREQEEPRMELRLMSAVSLLAFRHCLSPAGQCKTLWSAQA